MVVECERQEEVEFVSYVAPRGQNTSPPGMRPGVLVDPGPALAAVSRGSRVDGGAPLLTPVELVGGPAHDDATVKFLVMSALQRDEEERRRKQELDEVKLLEDEVAWRESRLLEEIERDRNDPDLPKTPQMWATLSRIEKAAFFWYIAKEKVEQRKEKRKKKKRRRKRTRRPCHSWLEY